MGTGAVPAAGCGIGLGGAARTLHSVRRQFKGHTGADGWCHDRWRYRAQRDAIGGALGAALVAWLAALGGFIGRQFGAGKGQDNKVFFQGQLGIGAGGTGAAAQLVVSIDKSIRGLLDATEEGVTNRMLEVAKGVRVQYDKEMSANDMANMAKARIGPAAQAIRIEARADHHRHGRGADRQSGGRYRDHAADGRVPPRSCRDAVPRSQRTI